MTDEKISKSTRLIKKIFLMKNILFEVRNFMVKLQIRHT